MHWATTSRLSVMESPEGAFSLKEQSLPTPVSVDSVWTKLGKAKCPNHSQSWFPHNFRFLLRDFLPNDVINWFGSWWKSIWHDFRFGEVTPWADFSISGDWLAPGSDTTTFGMVRSQQMSYNLPCPDLPFWLNPIPIADPQSSGTKKDN